jgi:hypothetical protein
MPDPENHNPRAAGFKFRRSNARSKPTHAMNKRQLIDDIRRYNPTAQPTFLAQFDEASLRQYFEHLQSAARKHVRIAGWVRKPRQQPSTVRLAS